MSDFVPRAYRDVPDGTKRCSRCATPKPLDEFSKWSVGRDGLQAWCVECNRSHAAERRVHRRSGQRVRESARRARKRSLPSETVLLHDVAIRDGAHCWMCGCERSEYDPAHLDHLIPISADPAALFVWGVENPGTVFSNLALACPSCNSKKRNRIMLCAILRQFRNRSLVHSVD